jgi:hypothetical protein
MALAHGKAFPFLRKNLSHERRWAIPTGDETSEISGGCAAEAHSEEGLDLACFRVNALDLSQPDLLPSSLMR